MFERSMIGLHVTFAAVFALLACAAIWWGVDFELLSARNGHAAWWFLGIWLLLSLAIAFIPPSIVTVWRTGLFFCMAVLVLVVIAGIRQNSPLAMDMAVALMVIAAPIMFVTQKLRAQPAKSVRNTAPVLAPPMARQKINWSRRLCWCVLALCMLEAFRLGQVSSNLLKGVGSAGMLLSFFVMLPALSVSTWFPRIASACWFLAAALLIAMAWYSSSISSALGVAPVVICVVLLWRTKPQDISKSELPQ
ncbi:MAG TPA: hypothetical protein VN114_09465 [Oxalicibacterium sp.]|uniref:hypothetical protein n=1 Tax=Oxalicibacterium sp. TaxID=2766525 RepID=UPI002B7180C8|nr:hypothetical protein [Oxalicibacterium sp.]HWU98729.1 hypothetical protein [Oxalicibacterium sp.]